LDRWPVAAASATPPTAAAATDAVNSFAATRLAIAVLIIDGLLLVALSIPATGAAANPAIAAWSPASSSADPGAVAATISVLSAVAGTGLPSRRSSSVARDSWDLGVISWCSASAGS
jgi:hypothetical protein